MEFTHRWIITVFFLVLKNNFVLDSPRRLIGFVFEWIFTFFKAKTKHLAVLKTLGMCLIKIAYRFLTASPRSTAQHPWNLHTANSSPKQELTLWSNTAWDSWCFFPFSRSFLGCEEAAWLKPALLEGTQLCFKDKPLAFSFLTQGKCLCQPSRFHQICSQTPISFI